MPHSAKARKEKTGEKDALRVLKALRGHLLAGNPLPTVWVPYPITARRPRGQAYPRPSLDWRLF